MKKATLESEEKLFTGIKMNNQMKLKINLI
jgi:hypothetical protein